MLKTKDKKIDKAFLITTIILVVAGFFIFISASLGVLTKGSETFKGITFNQIVFGLIGGSIACFITSRINYVTWRKYSFYIFILATIAMTLVFVPGLGFCTKGACRWIDLGFVTMQPSEIYKIAFILYLSTWLASVKSKASTTKLGTVPFVILLAWTALLVLNQPDTDTFLIIAGSGLAIFLTAGGKIRDIAIMVALGIVAIAILVSQRPYLEQRLKTFINPTLDPTGSGYQIQQSLIAIGSGGVFGRGFGQSIQKFNYLPEPIGDSIFAVAAEEFGLLGSVTIVMLYIIFTISGFKIALRSPDIYGSLIVIGIIMLITTQSFLNIAAMLGIIPLAGTPLLFISHGGTALFFALASVGIVMNVSRHQKSA